MSINRTHGGHILRIAFGISVLALLLLVSSAGASPNAYITNANSNSVSVIDTASNTVTATVPVGNSPVAFGQFIVPARLTPQQQIQLITTDIQELVTSGVLNTGQGNSLITKLDNATEQLNNGNTKAAINNLDAFINEVQAYIKTGKLTQAQGQELIDAADAVISQLGG